jgi:mono/diheme cytochrome c family protein
MKKLLLLLSCFASAAAFAAEGDAQRDADKFFENEVRPLLSKRCFECHSERKQKGGLRVDHLGYLKAGGDTGPALVPGKPEESPMIEAVHYQNKDFQMPPKQKLPDAEIAVLEKWIKMGAPRPAKSWSPRAVSPTSSASSGAFNRWPKYRRRRSPAPGCGTISIASSRKSTPN